MVAPIRDIGNKFLSISATHTLTSNMTLSSDMNIVIDIVDDLFKKNCGNYDEVRGHLMISNAQSPRTPSMSSSEYDEEYSARVQHKSNDMVENDQIIPSDSPQLKYATLNSQGNQVSKATNCTTNIRQQHVEHNAPTLNNNNVFNVQLQYNINQTLDPKSWNSNFWAISCHGFMEHLASNIKNIKESFGRMQKYILSKAIESDKANNIKDLEDVGKVAWEFISSLYEAY